MSEATNVLKRRATLEPNVAKAGADMLHGVLDQIEAATHSDMNQVRLLIAELRHEVTPMANAVAVVPPPEKPAEKPASLEMTHVDPSTGMETHPRDLAPPPADPPLFTQPKADE